MPDLINLNIILLGLYTGIAAACVIAAIVRNAVSGTVHRLIGAGATEKSAAKTADELGLGWLGRRILRGQLYGRIIVCANEYYVRTDGDLPENKKNPYKNPPLNMAEARFYIPEDKLFQAEERYPKKKIPILGVIAAIVILGVAFVILRLALPNLISMFTSAIS